MRNARFSILGALFFLIVAQLTARAQTDYSSVLPPLQSAVQEEMREWGISGISIALVDDQRLVHSEAFGEAGKESVFRCGSISKLFTAVAVMQQVEQGRLDLEAPLERYVPERLPINPFPGSGSLTLRQLLCHRSGIVRETPVGGYLDGSEPGLERTIASIRQTVLPTAPAERLRYSNVGPSLAGYIVAAESGQSFHEYQKEHVLGPLAMDRSAWRLRDLPRGSLLRSGMRIADGRGGFNQRHSPEFDLGTIPAGNLFTTAEDLARFIMMLAAEGRAPGGTQVLRPETLKEMFTVQLNEADTGFGLGFSINSFQGHKTVGHNGAVYGFSSSLIFLPKEKLGIVVLGNQDIVNGRIQNIAQLGLSLMLKSKLGEEPPARPVPIQVKSADLQQFAGHFESPSYWAELVVRDGVLTANISTQPAKLTPVGPRQFVLDSAIHNAAPLEFKEDASGKIIGFNLGGQTYTRVPPNRPAIPQAWTKYLGSYGPKFIPLVIHERHGNLYATTENMVDYRLTPVNEHVFEFPPGMYVKEHLVFFPGRNGTPHAASLAGMILRRR